VFGSEVDHHHIERLARSPLRQIMASWLMTLHARIVVNASRLARHGGNELPKRVNHGRVDVHKVRPRRGMAFRFLAGPASPPARTSTRRG